MQDGTSNGPQEPQVPQPPASPPPPPDQPVQPGYAPAPPPPAQPTQPAPAQPTPPPPAQPQPGYAPAPPPPAGYPPQGPPPGSYQPAPGYQAPPPGQPVAAEPPKRRRTGLWIGLGIALLVLLLMCGCATAFFGGVFSSSSKSKDAFTSAETHFTAASVAMNSVKQLPKKFDANQDARIWAKQFSAEVNPAVDSALNELDAAKSDLNSAGDSEAKTAYLASITSAQDALGQLKVMAKEVETIGNMGTQVKNLGPALSKGSSNLNAGMRAAGKGQWSTGIAEGNKAADGYAAAEKRMRALARDYPSLGFDPLIKEVALRRRAANELVAACEAGKTGNRSRYSSAIVQFNQLAAKTGKADTPKFLDNPNLLLKNIWTSYAKVNEELIKAEAAHAKAMQAVEAGKY